MQYSYGYESYAAAYPAAAEDNKNDPNGCAGFYDMAFDPWQFDRYDDFFTESSTFTLHPAGKFTGKEAIKEYVKFASDESPFVDAFSVLPGAIASLNGYSGVDADVNECYFTVMGHRRYELSAKYAGGQAVHVAAMSNITYLPESHKVQSIHLYYDTPFMQFVFDSLRSRRESAEFVCNLLVNECPRHANTLGNSPKRVFYDTRSFNEDRFQDMDGCVEEFQSLRAFDDGPTLELSDSLGGGFDGDSSSCRLLHSFLASINPDHCAHISFLPMADPKGRVKCQVSHGIQPSSLLTSGELAALDAFALSLGFVAGTHIRPSSCEFDLAAYGLSQYMNNQGFPAFKICGNYCGSGWCAGEQISDEEVCPTAEQAAAVPGDSCADTCCLHHDACCSGEYGGDLSPCNADFAACVAACESGESSDGCMLDGYPVSPVIISAMVNPVVEWCCKAPCPGVTSIGVTFDFNYFSGVLADFYESSSHSGGLSSIVILETLEGACYILGGLICAIQIFMWLGHRKFVHAMYAVAKKRRATLQLDPVWKRHPHEEPSLEKHGPAALQRAMSGFVQKVPHLVRRSSISHEAAAAREASRRKERALTRDKVQASARRLIAIPTDDDDEGGGPQWTTKFQFGSPALDRSTSMDRGRIDEDKVRSRDACMHAHACMQVT